MFTVGEARFARGYTGYDHLLDDRPLEQLIGRTYRDLDAALRAAGKAIRGTQDRRASGAPVIVLDETGTGSTYFV